MTWDEGVQQRQQQQQLIRLLVVPAALLLEPKYSSNEWYNQSLGSCNRCDSDGMSNLSSLGFHILDMLMILFPLSKHLLLVLLLLLLLFAAAPQSHFPLHLLLLLPRALQLVVLEHTHTPKQDKIRAAKTIQSPFSKEFNHNSRGKSLQNLRQPKNPIPPLKKKQIKSTFTKEYKHNNSTKREREREKEREKKPSKPKAPTEASHRKKTKPFTPQASPNKTIREMIVYHGDGDGCQVRVVQPPPHVRGYAVASFVHSCPVLLLLPRLLLLLLPVLLDVAAVVSQTTASPAGLLMMGGCSLQSLAAFPHHHYRYCCSLLLPPLLLPRQN
jgi:hypothetical protein